MGFALAGDVTTRSKKSFAWHGRTPHRPWVLDADIEGAFDNIGHAALVQAIGNFPARELIKQWLKAGYVEDADAASHRNRCAAGWGDQPVIVKCRPPWHGTSPGDFVYTPRRAPWDLRVGAGTPMTSWSFVRHTTRPIEAQHLLSHLARDTWIALVRQRKPTFVTSRRASISWDLTSAIIRPPTAHAVATSC